MRASGAVLVLLFCGSLPWLAGCGPGAPRSELISWRTTPSVELSNGRSWAAAEGFTALVVRLKLSSQTLYRGEGEFRHCAGRDFQLADSQGGKAITVGHRVKFDRGFTDASADVSAQPPVGMVEVEVAILVEAARLESDTFTLTYHDMPPLVLAPEKRLATES